MSYALLDATPQIKSAWAMLGLDAEGDEGESVTGAYAGDVRSTSLGIDDAIAKARTAKNGYGQKFAALYDRGDLSAHNGDHSAADMALVGMLAFWLGPDPERIDEAFRRSKLYRGKWDRPDYRDNTIGKVLRRMIAEGSAFYGDKKKEEQAADEPKREFRIYTMGDYRKRPAPNWLVKGIARAGSLIAIVGDFGSFKSFVALAMALAVAHGLPWYGLDTTQGAALFVMGEGSGGIAERVDAWNRQHGRGDTDAFYLLPGAPQLLDDKDLTALMDAIRDLPQTPKLIVIDTLARTFGGGNENSQEDMNRYVAAADKLKEEFGATVVILHHNNKQGEYRGSTVMPAALDTMIGTEPGGDGLTLRCLKQKDFEPFGDIRLKKIKLYLDDAAEPGPDTPIDFDRPSSLVFDLAEAATTAAGGGPGDNMTAAERKALTALAALNEVKTWASWSDWQASAGVSKSHFSTNVVPKLGRHGYIDTEEIGNGERKTHRCRITAAGRHALNPDVHAGPSQADWSAPFRGQEGSTPGRDGCTRNEPTAEQGDADAGTG